MEDDPAATCAFARPVWTARNKEEVRLQKQKMNLPDSVQVRKEMKSLEYFKENVLLDDDSDIPVVDMHSAVRSLEREQKRRFHLMDFLLALVLTVVLCVYALNARMIPNHFYLRQGVLADLILRPFLVESTSFDLNTPINSTEELGFYNNVGNTPVNQMPNLNPADLSPSPYYMRPFEFSQPDNNTLPLQQSKMFYSIRSLGEFSVWMNTMLNESQLFTGSNNTLLMLGKVRVRQVRNTTTEALCEYQSAAELAKFTLANYPTEIQGPNAPPTRASRLQFDYPGGGYVFDFSPSETNNNAQAWNALVDACDFLSPQRTMALSVSFTAYDYVSDSLVYAQFLVENFASQGGGASVLAPEADIRVFRVPGSPADSTANAWRIALCAVSLALLVIYLTRFIARYKHRYRKKYMDIWWDRWFVLNIISLCVLQAAVWVSLRNAVNAQVQLLFKFPPAESSFVGLYDNVSYDEKLADVLLGVCLIIESIKLFQLAQNIWPSFAAPYVTLNFIAMELLSWFLLVFCFFFFFSVGSVFIFGSWVSVYSTTGLAMQNTFLIFSKVPNVQQQPSVNQFSTEFWSMFDRTDAGVPLVWEVNSFFETYQVDGVVSYALWFSIIVLIIFWTLRNLLLGIVMTGYESVRREIDTLEEEAKFERHTHVANADKLPWYRKLERFVWKLFHSSQMDHFLGVMAARQSSAVVTTSVQMRLIFQECDLPQWFREEFLERFLFPLRLVDQAILLLVNEERCYSLSLPRVHQIHSYSLTQQEAVAHTFNACREDFHLFTKLPFFQTLGASAWEEASEEVKEYCLRLAARCPDTSSSGALLDISRFAQLLVRRVSSQVTTSEAMLQACVDELQLDFSSVIWDELLAYCDKELKRENTSVEEVVWKLCDVFPVRGFITSRPPTMQDLTNEDDYAVADDRDYTFNPLAQQKWETCLLTGEFALTLTVIAALRAQLVADFLHTELFHLEEAQIDLEKQVLQAQLVMHPKYKLPNELAVPPVQQQPTAKQTRRRRTSTMTSTKHGIEYHAEDNLYHVHFYSGKTYAFVGTFTNQEEAEVALRRTIDEYIPEEDDDEKPEDTADGQDDWETDNADYSSQAEQVLLADINSNNNAYSSAALTMILDQGAVFSAREEEVITAAQLRKQHCKAISEYCLHAIRSVFVGTLARIRFLIFGGTGEHTLTYDTTDMVWRDARGCVVQDVVTKPKTILPQAGNTYLELAGTSH